MRKILVATLATLGFIGAAYAATVEGVVQSVDPATRTVMLQDGKTFVAPEGFAVEQLKPGAKINVTVDDSTGTITAIEAAS